MFRTILVYGAIAGVLTIVLMLLGMQTRFGHSMLSGYLTMMAVMLPMIFIGTKRYRDNELGGVIKFWPAFGLALGIAAVAGVFYVITWEVSLQMTDFAFVDDFVAGMQASFEAKGLAGEELSTEMAVWEKWAVDYMSPAYRWPWTYLEILPVGLLVALFSAGLLRNPKVFPARV